ncbi:MAG: DUF1819 family protein [Methyloprofundus sp.]|nr:DUF1819 family protein [Methyloprofundus sp.]
MNVKKYLGDLNGGGLLIAETRIICEIQLKNLSVDEWKKLVVDENVLQKKSPQTALRFANVIRKRLEVMGKPFSQLLLDVSERAYIQLLMAAFMIQSPVIVDFMREYLAEARRTYKPDIANDAWISFIDDRIKVIPELASYSESTLKRMGSNVIKALVDTGYLKSTRQRQIQAVYLLPEVKELLININKQEVIDVMECTQ